MKVCSASVVEASACERVNEFFVLIDAENAMRRLRLSTVNGPATRTFLLSSYGLS